MKKIIYIIGLVFLISACQKEFLEKKPNKSLTNPSTIADYWALLDNREVMKQTSGLGQLASDDLYFETAYWATQNTTVRNSYIWAADVFQGTSSSDWNLGYQQVYYSNCVLEGLGDLKGDATDVERNNVRGSALFFRAHAFYNLAEIFAKPFSANAATDLGIPLRLSSDLSVQSVRASLQQTYDQILGDLIKAKDLVPQSLSDNRTRPTKPAVTALLARIYLSMGDFQLAEQYADSTLSIYDRLLDYNTVNQASTGPFSRKDNPEVLYESLMTSLNPLPNSNTLVDTALLSAYHKDDLRKTSFFHANPGGKLYFKGKYTNLFYLFSGVTTDETYLIRAECRARRGQVDLALRDLNNLLTNRWRKVNGSSLFSPYVNLSADASLRIILTERRKELVFRGLRWTDLRRLNREPEHQVTLRRMISGMEYTLTPGSNRYVFPIPSQEITLSGIQQNER